MPAIFNDEIHAPVRLRICGLLCRGEPLEFSVVRDTLGLTDSVISKHVSRLEKIGYVRTEKTLDSRYPRTRISFTDQGREAFVNHIAALESITCNATVIP